MPGIESSGDCFKDEHLNSGVPSVVRSLNVEVDEQSPNLKKKILTNWSYFPIGHAFNESPSF